MSKINENLYPFLPTLIQVDDYHELFPLKEILQDIFNAKLRVEEIGFNNTNGKYVGLVYYWGFKPTPHEVKDMANEKKIDLMDEE